MSRWTTAAAGAAGLVAALVLTACGAEPGPAPRPEAADGFAGFPACEDVTSFTADPALYRDQPRYGNPMELTDEVQAWAQGRPEFVEMWLDIDHHRWVTVGVHGDVDVPALQEEVARRWPGEGVVVVRVPRTHEELGAVLDRVATALHEVGGGPMAGYSSGVHTGVVSIHGVPGTAEVEDVLRGFSGEPLCVDGVVDPADIVPEGEQPTEGDGWRLLGEEASVGWSFRTAVATTDEQLAVLWRTSELPGPVPAVDWEREVVVGFAAGFGSSCPIRLDDVVVAGEVLHAHIVIPGAGPGVGCTDDANVHPFVVAVERTSLPTGPFVVQVAPESMSGPEVAVDVDLSVPGTTATNDEVRRVVPEFVEEPPPPLVTDGDDMPDGGARYVWHHRPGCSHVVLGPVGGTLWRLADGDPEWTESDGTEVRLLPVADDTIIVSAAIMDYAFLHAEEGVCR